MSVLVAFYFFFLGRESSLLLGVGEAGGRKSSAVNPDRVWTLFLPRTLRKFNISISSGYLLQYQAEVYTVNF